MAAFRLLPRDATVRDFDIRDASEECVTLSSSSETAVASSGVASTASSGDASAVVDIFLHVDPPCRLLGCRREHGCVEHGWGATGPAETIANGLAETNKQHWQVYKECVSHTCWTALPNRRHYIGSNQ